MVKDIKVKDSVYAKLKKLKKELGMSYSEVINLLLLVYEKLGKCGEKDIMKEVLELQKQILQEIKTIKWLLKEKKEEEVKEGERRGRVEKTRIIDKGKYKVILFEKDGVLLSYRNDIDSIAIWHNNEWVEIFTNVCRGAIPTENWEKILSENKEKAEVIDRVVNEFIRKIESMYQEEYKKFYEMVKKHIEKLGKINIKELDILVKEFEKNSLFKEKVTNDVISKELVEVEPGYFGLV